MLTVFQIRSVYSTILVLAAFLLLSILPVSAVAELQRPVRILPDNEGIARSELSSHWGIDGRSPVTGDVDADGEQEIFFISKHGSLLVGVDAFGNDLPGFPIDLIDLIGDTRAGGARGHVPALGDLDGDGLLEIVCGVDRFDNSLPSRLFAFEPDGSLYSHWPDGGVSVAAFNRSNAVISDLNGDGVCEIITAGNNINGASYIFVLRDDGSPFNALYPLSIAGQPLIVSTVAVGDLDGDGSVDLAWTSYDRKIHAIDHATTVELLGWPVDLPVLKSDIALGDVDGDGMLELVVCADYSDPTAVHIFDRSGNELPGWPQTVLGSGGSTGSPSLFDMDNDGTLEILLGSAFQVNIWRHDGRPYPGWPQTTSDWPTPNSNIVVARALPGRQPLIAYMGARGELNAWGGHGRKVQGFPKNLIGPSRGTYNMNTPSICDLLGDGDPEIVITSSESGSAADERFTTLYSFDLRGSFVPEPGNWASYHGNPAHTGLAAQPFRIKPGNRQASTAQLSSYPNPFNPQTTIEFVLDAAGEVNLSVYDLAGRRIRRLAYGMREAGPHVVLWQGTDDTGHGVATGVYMARLETVQGTAVHRLVLMK